MSQATGAVPTGAAPGVGASWRSSGGPPPGELPVAPRRRRARSTPADAPREVAGSALRRRRGIALGPGLAWVALVGVVPVALLPPGLGLAVWAGVVALLAVVDLLLAGAVAPLTAVRSTAPSVRLGETAELTLTVVNGGRRPVRGQVRDLWQPSAGQVVHRFDLALAPGASARFTTPVTPLRRGDRWALMVAVRSWGPLRLAARTRTVPVPGRVRVLPAFSSRKHLPGKLTQLRELEGKALLMNRGQGTEFDSLREYVVGDDVRSIDWRASARGGGVTVRTWRPERDRRVVIVLDTSRTAAARIGDAPRLDATMEGALLLTALAHRAGDRVDVLAVDRTVVLNVGRAQNTRIMPQLMEGLSTLEPSLVETDWQEVVTAVHRGGRRRALVVLLTALDPASLEEGLLPVLPTLASRHQVVLASVQDPELERLGSELVDVADGYRKASADRDAVDRQAVAVELARAGVDVLQAPPDEIAPRLADRYLALKAAGRL